MGWALAAPQTWGRTGRGVMELLFPSGPGLGVTLAVAALQREVLWPWGGLTPPPPSWSQGAARKRPHGICRGCSGEGLRGDGPVAAKRWDVLIPEG